MSALLQPKIFVPVTLRLISWHWCTTCPWSTWIFPRCTCVSKTKLLYKSKLSAVTAVTDRDINRQTEKRDRTYYLAAFTGVKIREHSCVSIAVSWFWAMMCVVLYRRRSNTRQNLHRESRPDWSERTVSSVRIWSMWCRCRSGSLCSTPSRSFIPPCKSDASSDRSAGTYRTSLTRRTSRPLSSLSRTTSMISILRRYTIRYSKY